MTETRGTLDLEGATDTPKPRRTRLLLIGIDAYQHWNALSYPVSDCEGFFKVLKDHYGFSERDLIHENKRPLYDVEATGELIRDELNRLWDKNESGKPHLSADDNLIVYYAGHGHWDQNKGYWVPVDAPDLSYLGAVDAPELKYTSDLKKIISVGEVEEILSKVPAHHIVLIVDACFPQTFARMTVDVPPSDDDDPPEEKPSRWVLTSGRLETVADRSPFAEALRRLLSNNDKPKLSIVMLGAEVMEDVRKSGLQNAWSASLTENRYDGGEFFFERRSPFPVSDQAPQPGITAETLPQRMRQGSKQYLERLKAGRFKYLRIEKLLLAESNLPDFVDTQVKVQEQVSSLQKTVQSLWGQAQPHAVIMGEGGMGKTVSMLRLWEDWLEGQAAAIPIFIALNEYNALREAERPDFVLRSIARNCGLAESLTDDWKNTLWDLLRQPTSDGTPSILLMLDGFNEVATERTPLLIELNRLAQEAKGLQMVITSRYVEIRNFQWAQQSVILKLQPLPADKIQDYLHGLGLPKPEENGMLRLLGNPMMLTIYAGSNQIAQHYAADDRFRFLPPQSVGELLWNFTEAQLVKYYEDSTNIPDEQVWHRFLLRCLLPYLAYRMEEHGDFFLAYRRRGNPEFNFQMLLDEAFVELNCPELTEVFPEFEGKRTFLGLGELPDLDAREQRARRVREYLVDKFTLLVLEKEALRFLHQNFRDFFAACHLLNMADMGIAAPYWTTRALPVYLRRILGQIEGEHHYDPQKVLMGAPMPGFQPNSRLARLLDRCRNTFHDEPTQTAVMNVVRTLAEGRETLAGADLRGLDLWKVYFNYIPMTAQRRYRYLPVQLDNSLIKGKLFFGQGHTNAILSVCYSPAGPDDPQGGKKILSGSADKTIKEWSVESGECLQTLQGHDGWVSSACYSPDGKKILSGSDDKTVKEWSVESGECLQTLQGHTYDVECVCYSPACPDDPVGGKKILSGSADGTVKEWSAESGECLQTFHAHNNRVNSVCYSPAGPNNPEGGKKILSGSNDWTVKEWSVESGECLQTLRGHTDAILSVCYSPAGLDDPRGGKKILSGSADGTVKEWSVESGECLQTLRGHTDMVSSVCYSPACPDDLGGGKNVLSGSSDGTVKEWSVKSGECLQTLQGHSRKVWSVCYNPASSDDPRGGKKILSGSFDQAVKEWSVESGECLQTLQGDHNNVICVCYSPNEKKILSGSDDKTVKEWSVKSGKCLQTLWGHDDRVWSVCYSPAGPDDPGGGGKILSGSFDGTVKEWSVESGECLQTLQGHAGGVLSVCYSPTGPDDPRGGKKILSRDALTMKEWSVETGECLQTLQGLDPWTTDTRNCRSSDGKKSFVGHNQTVTEWSVDTKETLQTFYNEPGLIVHGCDFSHCHPNSIFTAEEKERMRQYGAIFDEKDREDWEAAVAEARSGLEGS